MTKCLPPILFHHHPFSCHYYSLHFSSQCIFSLLGPHYHSFIYLSSLHIHLFILTVSTLLIHLSLINCFFFIHILLNSPVPSVLTFVYLPAFSMPHTFVLFSNPIFSARWSPYLSLSPRQAFTSLYFPAFPLCHISLFFFVTLDSTSGGAAFSYTRLPQSSPSRLYRLPTHHPLPHHLFT